MNFENDNNFIGNFSPNDGTIDFYLRIRSLSQHDTIVLDLGSGRAGWYKNDQSLTRKNIRLLRDDVGKVIAADIDSAVLQNEASDRQLIMNEGIIPLPNASIDLVIADYVFEHVEDTDKFISEICRVLKPGGWLCARTPHKLHYVALVSKLMSSVKQVNLIKKLQPNRNEADIFPTVYKLNSLTTISNKFRGWTNQSFVFRSNPSYYFGSRIVYFSLSIFHSILPTPLIGNLFIFLRKSEK